MTMMNTERLLARVFDVPYAVTNANRPVLTMWQMLTAQGLDPLDIDDFTIKAAITYDELVRLLRDGRADHLFVGILEPTSGELVEAYFSAPARALGGPALEKGIAAIVDHVRANAFEDDSGWH
jgi:hypothetical protein